MLTVQSAPPDIASVVHRRPTFSAWHGWGNRSWSSPWCGLGAILELWFAGSYEVLSYGSNAVNATYPISSIGAPRGRRGTVGV
jgi:hypothetical protein